jgi:hypothetical protein
MKFKLAIYSVTFLVKILNSNGAYIVPDCNTEEVESEATYCKFSFPKFAFRTDCDYMDPTKWNCNIL